MGDPGRARQIDGYLLFLVVLDVTLSTVAFFFPQLWFDLFHGVPYVDPQGYLRRCAANWTAFALFQAIALARWRRSPHWLAVVAGIRLSDIFTDWTYLWFCQDITFFGRASLFVVSPANLWLGWQFLRFHGRASGSDPAQHE